MGAFGFRPGGSLLAIATCNANSNPQALAWHPCGLIAKSSVLCCLCTRAFSQVFIAFFYNHNFF